ncbi:MAG: hypothetical protein LBF78_06145 [Treponema sp.]|jgi:hypothetical protein|nr:hypothetical protein [Treponema sp.]
MDYKNINAERAKNRAGEYAPGEIWVEVFSSIFMAAGRTPKSAEQIKTLEKEMIQARILAANGHTVYLLPEQGPRGTKHPDAVVDGVIMEFKTITGNIRKIAGNYKAARKKAENVFLKVDAPLTRHAVTRKLSGVIREKGYMAGVIWAYFTNAGEMAYWTVDDLR